MRPSFLRDSQLPSAVVPRMMNEVNPYAAPETDPIRETLVSDELQLATPSERFTGAFVDGLVGLVISVPVWVGFFLFGVFRSVAEMGQIGFGYTFLLTAIHFPIYMAIQWKSLKATGQTIGKKVAKTRIVSMEGKKPEVTDLIFKRYAFVSLLSVIPVAGGALALVDALMVFKKDRRCLHDLVAGTQVVKIFPGQIIP